MDPQVFFQREKADAMLSIDQDFSPNGSEDPAARVTKDGPTMLWQIPIEQFPTRPALLDTTVFVSAFEFESDAEGIEIGGVRAYELMTGTNLWNFETKDSWLSPVVTDGENLFVATVELSGPFGGGDPIGGVSVMKLDPKSGEILWKTHADSTEPADLILDVDSGQLMLVTTNLTYELYSQNSMRMTDRETSVTMIDRADGRIAGEVSLGATGIDIHIRDGIAYFLGGPLFDPDQEHDVQFVHSIRAHDLRNGELVWEGSPPKNSDHFITTDESNLYLFTAWGGQDPEVTAYDRANGTIMWNKGVSESNHNEVPLNRMDQTLLYRKTEKVTALDPLTGADLWTITGDAKVEEPQLTKIKDAAHLTVRQANGTRSETLYALNPIDQKLYWKYRLDGRLLGEPIIADRFIVFSTDDRGSVGVLSTMQ